MPINYNYNSREAIVQENQTPPRVTAEDIVITDFFDFSQITNVRTVRPPVIPGENADAPKMNGNELVLANISLNFLVSLDALEELKRLVGRNAAILEIRLVNLEERTPATLAVTSLNINAMQSIGAVSGVLPVSLNLEIDVSQVQSQNNIDIQTAGSVVGAVSQDLGFAFRILRATGEGGNQIGPPVSGTGYFLPYDMDDDLNDYYVVRSPVEITAAATALDQSLVTLYKSATCNAESAIVFRRSISPEGVFGSFEFVTEIDFSGESDTLIDENYVVSFVDGNPGGFSGNPLPKIDNTFAHQYRVIPVGNRAGGTPYIFRDAFTTPVSQASVSIGDNFRVLPIFNPGVNPKRSDEIRGYQLTDDNFLTPSSPMVSTKSDLAVITYRGPTNTGGVTVSVTGKKNPRTPVAIDFVRRDLTKNERRFTLIPSSRDVSSSPQQIVPVPSPGQQGTTFTMNFTDTTVVDGHTYEYAVRTYSKAGLTQLSEDTSVTTYFDPALLVSGEDLKLTATSPVLRNGSIIIDFEVEVPQNVISLLESLVNTRIGSRESPFAEDIVSQRRNLSPQPAPIVRRLNRTTGREVDFKLMGSTARKFEQTNDPQEGVGIQNKFNFRFTDDELEAGSEYQYEILVNLRDPLSVTDEKTFVVPREREPYIFQSCKIFNPLFIGRGILPPTQRGQNFILQKNIDTGRDRLLNLLTAADTWDLGRTSLQALVPNEPITVPLTRTHVRAPAAQRTRVGEASVSWSVSGDLSNIDHYRIYSRDSYVDQDRNVMIKKSLVANIPAQISRELTVKSRLKTLTEEDAAQFLPRNVAPLSMLDLQRLVDLHEVSVKRSYDIVVINSQGLIESVAETRPVEIWSSRLNKLSPLSDKDLAYVIPPSTVFSEGNKSNGSKPLDVQSQAEETRQASGYGQAASNFATNTGAANAYIAGQQVVGDNAVANTYSNTAVGGNGKSASNQAERVGYDENAAQFGGNAPGMKSPPPGGNKNNGNGGNVSLGDLDAANSGHGQDLENTNFKWGI